MTNSILCPCANVRQTCAALLEDDDDWTTSKDNNTNGPRGVRINDEALTRLASSVLGQLQQNNNTLTSWDEHEWHYTGRDFVGSSYGSIRQRQERVALYILALDAINFCFWPTPSSSSSEEQQQQQGEQQGKGEQQQQQQQSEMSTNKNNDSSSNNFTPKTFWVEYAHLATTLKYMAQRDDNINYSREEEEEEETNDPFTATTTTTITTCSSNYAFSPQRLASITVDEMTLQLQEAWDQQNQQQQQQQQQLPSGTAPSSSSSTAAAAAAAASPPVFILNNMKERCRLWNELGAVLLQPQFQGSATLFLQQGLIASNHGCCSSSNTDGWSSCSLVKWLIQHCSGFRDEAVDDQGRWICFYKRAQICVADLHGALDLTNLMMKKKKKMPNADNTETEPDSATSNNNKHCNMTVLDALTTFADYRVPQYLRHVQVLEYSPSLAAWIDQGLELSQYRGDKGGGNNSSSGRMQELYIRAATVVTAQRLVEECHRLMKMNITTTTTTTTTTTQAVTTTAAMTTTTATPLLFHLNDVLVDWYLWQLGEGMLSQMKPHHRVRTIYY